MNAPVKDQVAATLETRGHTHGKFRDNAHIALTMRDLWRESPGWARLSSVRQLVLDEIALKIARILSGASQDGLTEHFHDIAGYSKLGEEDAT